MNQPLCLISDHMKLNIIICAAGNGSRIGKSKVLLKYNNELFLNSIIRKLALDPGCISVVIKEEDYNQIIDQCNYPVHWIFNNRPESSMIYSVKLGLKHTESETYAIHPIDHPLIEHHTYQQLFDFTINNPDCIIKPQYQGQNGHPVFIPFKLRNIMINDTLSDSHLNNYIHQHSDKVKLFAVDDPGIIININSISDLEAIERKQ